MVDGYVLTLFFVSVKIDPGDSMFYQKTSWLSLLQNEKDLLLSVYSLTDP